MNVNVNWDRVPSSKAAEGHINSEIGRLRRHLPPSANLHLRVGHEGQRYQTKVHVHALGHDWVALGDGDNLWAGITAAFDKIVRKLAEFKSTQKNRIHRNVRGQNNLFL